MEDLPIAKIMTHAPATVAPSDSVAAAERLMRERRCHHVPVVSEGRVVGLLAARDLMKALVLRADAGAAGPEPLHGATLEERRVSEIMQRSVPVLPSTATLLDAARALRGRFDGHALPVVEADGRLVGIVTTADVVDAAIAALERPARAPAATPGGDDAERRALRGVYRAVLQYLGSGRGDLEHGRLLRAVSDAREALRPVPVNL